MFNDILPDFQRYLADRKLVSLDKIPFHALWVSKFLAFSNKCQDKNLNARIAMFLDSLVKEKQLPDWQVEQAGNAIRLYTDHFLSGNTASLAPDAQQVQDTNKLDVRGILEKLRETIRIKHYSYSTERTYLDWSRRFFAYLEETKKNSLTEGLDERQVRDFLSHLAIRQMVSSSTQNQAFNALLFLFREVLKIELKDLGKTVRAKRGPKLPVVLITEEVQKILEQLSEAIRISIIPIVRKGPI